MVLIEIYNPQSVWLSGWAGRQVIAHGVRSGCCLPLHTLGRGRGPGGRGVGMLSQQALLHASAVTRSVPSSHPASPPILLPARLCVAEVLQLSILRGLGNLPVRQRVQLPYHGQCFPPAAGHREGPGSTRGACTKHLLPARQASWAPRAATPHTLTSFPPRAPHPAPRPGRTGVSQRPPCSVLGHDCEPEAPCGSGNPELQQQCGPPWPCPAGLGQGRPPRAALRQHPAAEEGPSGAPPRHRARPSCRGHLGPQWRGGAATPHVPCHHRSQGKRQFPGQPNQGPTFTPRSPSGGQASGRRASSDCSACWGLPAVRAEGEAGSKASACSLTTPSTVRRCPPRPVTWPWC